MADCGNLDRHGPSGQAVAMHHVGRGVMKNVRLIARRVVLLLILPVVVPLGYFGYLQGQGNFSVVSEGRLYRSAQLSHSDLLRLLSEYGIRSIVNLRGQNVGSGWYQDELAAAKALGAAHYDYGLSANYDVDEAALDEILNTLATAPKPILIHCKAGADRTSLIAAVYLFAIEGKSAEEASRQLSVLYGHFPYLMSSTDAMDRSFWHYVDVHRTRISGEKS